MKKAAYAAFSLISEILPVDWFVIIWLVKPIVLDGEFCPLSEAIEFAVVVVVIDDPINDLNTVVVVQLVFIKTFDLLQQVMHLKLVSRMLTAHGVLLWFPY